jgi:hypothetical protein
MALEIKQLLPLEGVKWLFLGPRVTEINKGCMDSEVTILNDKFQLVALSHGVEFVIGMSTGAVTRATK